ncbi:anti-sigma factor RsbA family regulatory protein [Actinacidiphila sp. ITFR-21]|uniref:anti-sigma factor RsbA family regulatory protein n=1 Tax=Actinacidiphila sp. ITFR-21 TaxID=3075199 RepID=UPI00288A0CE8|nr:anti-sigma factor RsbA family regulatory protein [Streptomyces sp. ITFR-21]WNI14513.1 anti-sigma factor RsbA family regulatory protein [Streptomyces sp. ITFR-21]
MTAAFAHPALFYRGDAEYLAGTTAFVRAGLAVGEPVAAAVPPDRLALLRAALGADAAGVRFTDMAAAGRNPGRIIPGVLRAFCDAQPPGRRIRIVGEPVWPGRTDLEYPACVQHEALTNAAFHGCPVTILCPYDAERLTARALADARATHPAVIEGGRERTSAGYAPERAAASYNTPLAVPPYADRLTFDREGLRGAREFAVRVAGGLGLRGTRLDDVALAVSELTTNSVLHGGGSGVIRLWAEDGRLACEVRDGGRIGDPLAGREVPPPGRPGGRGLLMVHQLADLVRQYTGPDGTAIRCYFDPPVHPAGAPAVLAARSAEGMDRPADRP